MFEYQEIYEVGWKFVLDPWKDIYKTLERTIWVKLYYLLVREFARNIEKVQQWAHNAFYKS